MTTKTKRWFAMKMKSAPKPKTNIDIKQSNQIKRLQKRVKQIVNSEPKYVLNVITETTTVNSTPKAHLLNGIAQGDTNETRDGNKVRWTRAEVRLLIKSNSALTAPTYLRVLLVRRVNTGGASFSFAELFDDSTPDVLDQYNRAGSDIERQFKIYYDKHFLLGPARIDYTSATGHNAGQTNEYYINFSRKFNFVTDYALGTDATVGSIDTNSLHLLVFSDNSTANAVEHYGNILISGTEM